ncbi:MAG: hypothetical protein ACD_75C00073G0001 [uncultured bacterium]|nr:MAG: hypothetical protein ACD_75C00073G0001 [uncultured bacterium]
MEIVYAVDDHAFSVDPPTKRREQRDPEALLVVNDRREADPGHGFGSQDHFFIFLAGGYSQGGMILVVIDIDQVMHNPFFQLGERKHCLLVGVVISPGSNIGKGCARQIVDRIVKVPDQPFYVAAELRTSHRPPGNLDPVLLTEGLDVFAPEFAGVVGKDRLWKAEYLPGSIDTQPFQEWAFRKYAHRQGLANGKETWLVQGEIESIYKSGTDIHRKGNMWTPYRLPVYFVDQHNIENGVVDLDGIKGVFPVWKRPLHATENP